MNLHKNVWPAVARRARWMRRAPYDRQSTEAVASDSGVDAKIEGPTASALRKLATPQAVTGRQRPPRT